MTTIPARWRAWLSPGRAADRSTRNGVRSADIPRTGQASTAFRVLDRACPSRCRSADNECADRRRPFLDSSIARFEAILVPLPVCNPVIPQSRNDYDSTMIPAIVLAAGKSTRMGRLKANLPLGAGHTFLTRVVGTFLAAGVDDVVVVVGYEAEKIIAEFATGSLPARFVENREYERGQLSSLLCGRGVVD